MTPRILIAEDHQPLADSLVALLKRRGYQAEHAADGIAALRAIAGTPPDLLLLDLNLPALHGVELLKKLRKSPLAGGLPVIVITGVFRGDRYRQAAAALGVRHYLEKPFKAADLLRAIAELLPAAGDTAPPPPSFARYLQQAFQRRFTGELHLCWPDRHRIVSFLHGTPVALAPASGPGSFGDYLRSLDLIAAGEYDYLIGPGADRPEALVELGCLAHEQLREILEAYLTQELSEAFGAPPARGSWQAMSVPESLHLVTLNVPQLFYRGFRHAPGRDADWLLATCLDKYPTPSGNYYRYINFLDLAEEDRLLLRYLDGRHTLADYPGDPAAGAPLLLTLASLDMLRFTDQPGEPVSPDGRPIRTFFNAVAEESAAVAELQLESFADLVEEAAAGALAPPVASPDAAPPAAAAANEDLAQSVRLMARSLEGKNHYEVFGIKPARFTIELLKERYFAVTRQFGPDILMQLGGEDASLVEQILATVANAYNTLSDVVKKERYDELLGADRIGLGHQGDDRFQAQVQAESGKVFIGMEEWDSAEKALQEAVNFDPGNGDYLAHLGWAIYRNPRNSSSRAMQEKARQLVNRAVALQRTAPGLAFKGWMLLEGGQDQLAEAEFGKALKLDARQMLARRGLQTLQEKKEQQKRGLFGRMFR